MAYDKVEPIITGLIIDAATARQMKMQADIWTGADHNFDSFMPGYWSNGEPAPTPEQIYRQFRTWALLNQPANSLKEKLQ
jgi:hypothetical protein